MTDLGKRYARQIRFLQNRISPEGFAGLHLTVGVLVVLAAGYWFGEIAERLSPNDSLVLFDQRLALWFHQHATPAITYAAKAITFFGSVAWLTTLSICLVVYFISRDDRLNAFLVTLTMLGGGLLNIFLKHYFHRQRPVLENPLVTLSSYGFPSGHTMGATLLYGLLALLAWSNLKSLRARLVAALGACLLILLIGFTRIYLGAHFLSDVLGAFTAGILWLAFCWTAIATVRRRYARRPHG
jgi:membrane-associated phospholipid phosphatase